RGVLPVVEPAADGEGERRRHVDEHVPAVVGPACLQHQHPGGRVGRQPVRQGAAGRAAARDHVVIARLCHRPSPGWHPAPPRGKRSEAASIPHYATRVVTSPEDLNLAPASYPQSGFPDIPGSADILLIRHGQSEPYVPGTPFPIVDGHADPGLTPAGQDQPPLLAPPLATPPLAPTSPTPL